MLGLLDCIHVHWKNCSITFQGAYMGKEKYLTIVLEAMADHNLWFWHTVFRFAGCCNDINILDASLLHKCFIDGTHSHIDFDFAIGNDLVFQSHITSWMVFTPSFSVHQNNLHPNLAKGKCICGLAGGGLQRC